jgi:hypothetical protein
MINTLINKVRSFGYTMKNPIPRKIFLLRNFAPAHYIEFRTLMYTLNTQLHLGVINEEQFENALLSF